MSGQDLPDQHQIDALIKKAELTQVQLKERLAVVEIELEVAERSIPEYQKLIEVSKQLEELHESGAGELFWGTMFKSEDDLISHIDYLRIKVDHFNESIDKIKQKKEKIEIQLKESLREISYLNNDKHTLKEIEEENRNHLFISREFVNFEYVPVIMPWDKNGEDEKRFRRYLLLAVLYSILIALVLPMWNLPVPEIQEEIEIPERLVKFIKREKIKKEAKPKPEVEAKVATKKKKATTKEIKQARKKATKSGLLAFKNNFADLMDDATEAKLGANAKLSKQGSRAKSSARSLITDQVKSGSAGINTANLSREVGGAGGKVGSVKFSRVTSEIGSAVDDRPLSDTLGPSRTDEEIQIVFDRYKATLYRIYNRELRKNPTLQGKMVLRITILSNGKVSACAVESTDLDSKVLSEKIVARVKRFNFGDKKDVPKITILYPIDFLPAS